MRKQLFTIRLSDSLMAAVENVKLRWKESSSSEVARRLLELGVIADQQTAQANKNLYDDPKSTLLVLRDRYYRDDPLTREEWKFLARYTHGVYMYDNTRSFVSRSYLLDVLHATHALLAARNSHFNIEEFPSDGYYRSKLGLQYDEPLLDGIKRVASDLPQWPDLGYAEHLTRPIEGYFNDAEPCLPDTLLNEALKPYLLTLLTLAIHTFWKKKKEPITQDRENLSSVENMRHLSLVKVDGISLSFTLIGQSITANLDFGEICPMLLTLSSLPTIQDFFDLISVGTQPIISYFQPREYQAAPRRITLPIQEKDKFILWDGDKSFYFDSDTMKRIANLVNAARQNPEFSTHEKSLRLTYGAI